MDGDVPRLLSCDTAMLACKTLDPALFNEIELAIIVIM